MRLVGGCVCVCDFRVMRTRPYFQIFPEPFMRLIYTDVGSRDWEGVPRGVITKTRQTDPPPSRVASGDLCGL